MVGGSAMPSGSSSGGPNLRARTLLVIGMYYAPETTGSAPYTTDVAEFLAACGADVHVITTAPHYPMWRREQSFRRHWSRKRIHNVTVHRVPAYIPRHPTLARRLVYEGSFVAAALPALATSRVDAVIGTSPNLFSAALAAAYAGSLKRPLMQLV